MTKWPVQKLTHRTTQKHVQHHDFQDIKIILFIKQVVVAVCDNIQYCINEL